VSWTDEEEQEFYRFHEESFYASNVRDLTGLSDQALFRQKGQSKVLPGSPGGLAGDGKIMEGDWFLLIPCRFLNGLFTNGLLNHIIYINPIELWGLRKNQAILGDGFVRPTSDFGCCTL